MVWYSPQGFGAVGKLFPFLDEAQNLHGRLLKVIEKVIVTLKAAEGRAAKVLEQPLVQGTTCSRVIIDQVVEARSAFVKAYQMVEKSDLGA